jgi:hypothetical protein
MTRIGRMCELPRGASWSFVPGVLIAVSVLLVAATWAVDTASAEVEVVETTMAPADSTSAGSNGSDTTAASADTIIAPVRVVVYYFHRTARCDNCLKFEAYTEEAINLAFMEELAEGSLVWQAVNLDEVENEHYVNDFDVSRSSVVLVRYDDDEPTRWAHLGEIWTYVDDKPVFIAYIQNEIGRWLDDLTTPDPETNEEAPPDSIGG